MHPDRQYESGDGVNTGRGYCLPVSGYTATRQDKQQTAVLDSGNCTQHFRHAGKERHIAFLRLVGVINLNIHEHFTDLCLKSVTVRYGRHDALDGHVMP